MKTLLRKYLKRRDFQIAVKTGVAASLSFLIATYYTTLLERPGTLLSGLWCVVAAIVTIQAHLGSTYKAAWLRIIGVFIGSVLGGAATIYLGEDMFTVGFTVFLTILLCALFNLKEAYRIAGMSAAVVMLLSGVQHDIDPWIFSFFRFLDSCIGIAVAVVVSHTLWPEQTWESIQRTFSKAVEATGKFYRQALDFEVEHDNRILSYEIFDYLSSMHKELEESKLEFMSSSQRGEWLILLHELEKTIEAIAILKRIPKYNLSKIFDDSLARQVQEVITQTEQQFDQLEEALEQNQAYKGLASLIDADKALQDDLERFRQTRTTRRFDLTDVESFYTFFYNVHFVARQLQHISELV